MSPYPDTLTLTPIVPPDGPAAVTEQRPSLELSVPGSKSLTNRALLVAALADGVSTLRGGLLAEDSEVMTRALSRLGFEVEVEATTFRVRGLGGTVPSREADLDLSLSGTSIRFLSALVALGEGRYHLDGNERMRQRPIGDLLDALGALGARAESRLGTGCPPVLIEANGLRGGEAEIGGDRSSQFLSALLMVAPYADAPVTLTVGGELQSKPFADMTLGVMRAFGVEVERDGYRRFRVPSRRYAARDYPVEGDAMAAGYFWAAAAVTGGRVRVGNVGAESLQGDRRLADVLGSMGCTVAWEPTASELWGPPAGRLRGGVFDLNDMPDQAQTLAVAALFADGPVAIENVWNMRIKETDRIAALATELTKFGARVEEGRDRLVVHPPDTPRGRVEVDTYGDHRMAMAFALAGLRLPGVTIRDPGCVAKTYPNFFEDWARWSAAGVSRERS